MNALTLLMQVLACRLGVVTGLGIFFVHRHGYFTLTHMLIRSSLPLSASPP